MKDTQEGSWGEFGEDHLREAGTKHRSSDELTIL